MKFTFYHNNINVFDLEKSVEFYQKALGLTITKEKEAILKFLMNKKPKIIKDTNGNNWLVYFTGNPSMSYNNNYGQGMVKVNAEWTEVGDPNDKTDLYENGLIPTKR